MADACFDRLACVGSSNWHDGEHDNSGPFCRLTVAEMKTGKEAFLAGLVKAEH